MKFFETHAHYNDKAYDNNLDEVLQRCKKSNVETIINIGYNKESSNKAIELAKKYDYMYAVIGVHPHDVENDTAEDILKLYTESDMKEKILAIGEIGLDYAFVKDNKEKQEKLFINQINLANKLRLPVVIHTREASLDTYKILKNNKPQYGALLHCFKPTDDLMKLVLEDGYYVAFGGNITYKRSKSFGEYVKKIPIEKIVLETDSPYLAPEPYKGQVNDSSNLPIILDKLSEFLEIDKNRLSEILYENSLRFFNIKNKA